MRKLASLAALAAVALLAAGCGGGGASGGDDAAAVVPADAIAYATIDLDSDSEQWKQASALVSRFPDGPALLRRLLAKADVDWDSDVKPALGDRASLALLGLSGGRPSYVLLVKPDDPDKLRSLLAKSDEPHAEATVGGWTAIAENRADLDALKQAQGGKMLSNSDAYREASSKIGSDQLAALFLNGPRALEALRAAIGSRIPGFDSSLRNQAGRLDWAAAGVSAHDDGLRVEVHAQGANEQTRNFTSTLVDDVPAGALLVASFSGKSQLGQLTPQQRGSLGQLERLFGLPLRELAGLLGNEAVLYVRPGLPIPEVTLVARTRDEARARTPLDRLAVFLARFGAKRGSPTTIAGIRVQQVRLGSVTVLYAAFDGKLVVTTSPDGIASLRAGGDRLADDPDFQAAKKASGLPDENAGFLYVNVADSLPLLRGLAQLKDAQVPDRVWANLRPVRALVAYAAVDGQEQSAVLFAEIQ